jgi:hypothetical protein
VVPHRRLGLNTLVNFERAEPRFAGQFSTSGNTQTTISGRRRLFRR